MSATCWHPCLRVSLYLFYILLNKTFTNLKRPTLRVVVSFSIVFPSFLLIHSLKDSDSSEITIDTRIPKNKRNSKWEINRLKAWWGEDSNLLT